MLTASLYSTVQGIVLLFFGILLIFGSIGRSRYFELFETKGDIRKYKKVMFITGLIFILLSFVVDTVISWFG